MEEKYTKKANAYIMKAVLKVKPDASKLTSYDQAFVILMSEWDMEGSMETDTRNHTVFGLYRDGEVIKKYEWNGLWIEKEGDWDWTTIYKEVLEDIIKHRLYKRPKISKRNKKSEKKETLISASSLKKEKKSIKSTKKVKEEPKKETKSKVTASKTPVKSTQTKKMSKCVVKEKEAVKSKENKKSTKNKNK